MELTNYNKDKKQRRKQQPDISSMVYGKVPPQAKELEEAILGAIMLEKNAFDVVSEILKPQCFYVDAHQRVFSAMKSLAMQSLPIDEMTVIQELIKNETLDLVGGPYAITQLTKSVVSAAHIEYHSHLVHEKFLKRELIRLGGQLLTESYEDSASVKEIMSEHEKEFTGLTLDSNDDHSTTIDQALVKAISRIEELKAQDQDITGIPTGFPDLDKITHGWQNGDLIILAARPSVGKTALALNLARHACINKIRQVPVAFFSLEMSTQKLTERLMSAESGIWLDKITNGKVDDEELKGLYNKAVEPLSKTKIHIDDNSTIDIMSLKTKCRRLKRKHNIGLIIVDYLQLMNGDTNDSRNREREISQISRGLKIIAKELNVPVIALSQLSRETEKRKGEAQTPRLSDLRESGAIEQDADIVAFLYRPEYYQISANEHGESTKGETHLSIAKHRNGNLAMGGESIKLRALLHIQKFVPWNGDNFIKPSELPGGNWRPLKTEETDGLNF